MGHLSLRTLARLVDGRPTAEEARQLNECEVSQGELQALREQTAALGNLPDIVPPAGDWRAIESRLRNEGLISVEGGATARVGRGTRHPFSRGIPWRAVAAAVVLFLGGALTGAAVGPGVGDTARRFDELDVEEMAKYLESLSTPEEVARALRDSESQYVSLRARYEMLVRNQAGDVPMPDEYARLALLEQLAATSQAMVRRAPADAFFNGLHVSVLGEREATAVRLVSTGDEWY